MAAQEVTWCTVCIDCGNADELAEFYGRLLGWEIGSNTGDPGGDGEARRVAPRNPPGTVGLRFQAEDGYEPPRWPEEPGARRPAGAAGAARRPAP